MTKFLTALVLAVLSQQTLAVTIVGIEFLDIANKVDTSAGTFDTNDASQVPAVNSAVDGNAASYTYGMTNSPSSTLEVSFRDDKGNAIATDVANANLTMLFVGSNPHTGTVDLLGGSTNPDPFAFTLTPYVEGPPAVFTGYTGFNSVTAVQNPGGDDDPTAAVPPAMTLGIFALTINLSEAFSGFTGNFTGVGLNIYDGAGGSYDSALSLVGTTATTAVVPVPAAVWLFGSGLIGIVGVARRKK